MDDNDLVPFPNEVVSTLFELVSFLIKLFVRLLVQQTIEPHDSCVFIRKEYGKNPLSIYSATNPIHSTRILC
jgi:hypothetical protein